MSTTAASPFYTVPLTERREVADRTLEVHFDKPPGFAFKAGQFADLTWIDPPETDAEGNTRGFSINGAPDEADLMFTTRLRDTAFKRVLKSAPLGTKAKMEGPFGNLVLHNNPARPAIMLAGGIGITPFRSIVRRAAHEKLPHRIFLFYANRRPEDAPFLDEMRNLEQQNPNFTFIPTMTAAARLTSAWGGETGRIDRAMIERHVKAIPPGAMGPVYYIAGPAPMVAGLHAMLNQAGIDDDDIRTEEFSGY